MKWEEIVFIGSIILNLLLVVMYFEGSDDNKINNDNKCAVLEVYKTPVSICAVPTSNGVTLQASTKPGGK